MNCAEKTCVRVEGLDYVLKSQLAEFSYMTICNMFDKADVSFEEYRQALDNGLRDDLDRQLKDYYSFMADLEFDISDSDLYDLHCCMYG